MFQHRLLCTALAITMAFTVFVACGPEDDGAPEKHKKVEAKHPINLPPKPNLDSILNATRVYPDGHYSITGLIVDGKQATSQIEKQISIKGVIRKTSDDCPFLTDPKEVENRPMADDPDVQDKLRTCGTIHMWMSDGPFGWEMLVVNYPPFFHPHFMAIQNDPSTRVEVIVRGLYTHSDGRFHRPRDGLIVVDEVLNLKVDYLGNFYSKMCKVDDDCTKPDGSKYKCLDLTDVEAEGGGDQALWCQPEVYTKPKKTKKKKKKK